MRILNTYYVSWNLDNSPYIINDETLISKNPPNNWYDYTEGVNHWANVKTTGGWKWWLRRINWNLGGKI